MRKLGESVRGVHTSKDTKFKYFKYVQFTMFIISQNNIKTTTTIKGCLWAMRSEMRRIGQELLFPHKLLVIFF